MPQLIYKISPITAWVLPLIEYHHNSDNVRNQKKNEAKERIYCRDNIQLPKYLLD